MRVLITGASRGIGLQLVLQYLARGDEVIATLREPEQTPELRAHASARLKVIAMDVGSAESVHAAAARCPPGPLHVLELADALALTGDQRTRTKGLFEAMKAETVPLGERIVYDAFIERLRAADSPRILVNVSSDSGSLSAFRPSGKPEYAMSKAALNALTLWQASQEPQVTCVAIHPGWTRTAMGGDSAPASPEETAARMVAAIDKLHPEQSGLFLNTDLRPQPW